MSTTPDLRRLSLLAAVAGLAALAVGELASGEGFTAGLGPLVRGIANPSAEGGLVPMLCFAAACLLAAASYAGSLYRIAAGTRLVAALTRDAGVEQPSLRVRIARAVEILVERRGSAPERASAAIDELLVPLAGEGVSVSHPSPFTALGGDAPAEPATRDWRARAGQRTGVSGQTDRWATPARDDEEGRP